MTIQANQPYTEDGMLRLAGAVIRQAIVDGHPASRRIRTARDEVAKEIAINEQRQAQSFVFEIFEKNASCMALVERYWNLPWEMAKKFFRKPE